MVNRTEQTHTTREFSKLLADNGCKLRSENSWCKSAGPPYNHTPKGKWVFTWDGPEENQANSTECYRAYDILNDICVRYADKFFNGRPDNWHDRNKHIIEIIYQLYNSNKQEAESYFWENTIFNPKNKEHK